ncbi:MAG: hypothetical protein M3323_12520 [Actinomycetota bacterium]|nr:hypothetical protein [Actinomycetota bacterium]
MKFCRDYKIRPDTLLDVAGQALDMLGDVTGRRDGCDRETAPANDALAGVSAGTEWQAFRTALKGALERLAAAQVTFALNTEAAAVAYEDADLRSMGGDVPPIPPSPEDLEKAREEAEKSAPPWYMSPEDQVV